MTGRLIPDAWALPMAAMTIGITVDEAQALVDAGDLDVTSRESVVRHAAKRDLQRLKTWMPSIEPTRRSKARRS